METSTSMYYTFSTIAQVLAAFIALSGVFVIFKIQELRKMQLQHVHNFINQVNRIPLLAKSSLYNCREVSINLVNLHRAECLDGMTNEMNKILDDPIVKGNIILKDIIRIPSIFNDLEVRRINIIRLAKISMLTGVPTILYSIIVLAIVPEVICLNKALYIIGIAGLTTSIFFMMKTIIISLSSELQYEQTISQQ